METRKADDSSYSPPATVPAALHQLKYRICFAQRGGLQASIVSRPRPRAIFSCTALADEKMMSINVKKTNWAATQSSG